MGNLVGQYASAAEAKKRFQVTDENVYFLFAEERGCSITRQFQREGKDRVVEFRNRSGNLIRITKNLDTKKHEFFGIYEDGMYKELEHGLGDVLKFSKKGIMYKGRGGEELVPKENLLFDEIDFYEVIAQEFHEIPSEL